MPFANVHQQTLHYAHLQHDDKPHLILINSLGTNLLIWSQLISLLSDQFQLLLHDKRGHGLSLLSQHQPTIDDYADDVIGLMDHCGISSAHVLGLSIGGLITYSLASRYPDRCDKLIFSNTGAQIGTLEGWEERIEAIREGGLSGMGEGIIQRWLSDSYAKNNPHAAKGYQKMLEMTEQEGYMHACRAIGMADFREAAKAIQHPSMFMVGSEDIGTTPDFVKEQAAMISGARYHEISGVAHLPCLEAPEEVALLIQQFLI
ncbi:MAG: 3-oxoadipate enol-lactonase [Bacteroidota bacterium]